VSAFIVSKKTIDVIVTYLYHKEDLKVITNYYPTFNLESENHLGQQLLNLNTKAVDRRYNERNPVELYQYHPEFAGKVQVYKSLRCLLYQCSEGNIPETKLFQDLDRYAYRMARVIIGDLPEYEKAAWDAWG